MKKNSFFCFVLSFVAVAQVFAQEASTVKKIYKIDPADNSGKQVKETEMSREKNCVYSCETDSKTNQAILTTIDDKGVIKKETYVLKTDKK